MAIDREQWFALPLGLRRRHWRKHGFNPKPLPEEVQRKNAAGEAAQPWLNRPDGSRAAHAAQRARSIREEKAAFELPQGPTEAQTQTIEWIRIGAPLPARGWRFDGIILVNRAGTVFVASKWWPARMFGCCCDERMNFPPPEGSAAVDREVLEVDRWDEP